MHSPELSITKLRKGEEEESQKERPPLSFSLLKRLFLYTRPYAALRNRLFIAVILRSIQMPCLAAVLGMVIQQVIEHRDVGLLSMGTIFYVALAVFTISTLYFRQKWALEIGEFVIHDLRNDIFVHLQRMQMSFFDKTKLGSIISRMTSDTLALRSGVQSVFFVSIVGIGQMIFAAIFMACIDLYMFMVVMLITPVLWQINRYFRNRLSLAYRNVQESFSRVTATLAESVAGIRVTQGYSRQKLNAKLFSKLIAHHGTFNVKAGKEQSLFLPLIDVNNQMFMACLLLLGGYRVMNGHMHIGDIVQFFFLAEVFFSPVQTLGKLYDMALAAMAGAERVFDFLDTQPHWKDPSEAKSLSKLSGKVEFKDIGFSYDPEKPVLKDISFSVEAGQMIALVGHTGSGKSTIINLLAKFYLPTSGKILLDDMDITQIRTRSLHRQLGIVLQTNFLFTGTVMDNIRFAKPHAKDEEIYEAAKKLDCFDLIENLPMGFATEVGERGNNLSLGQRQLICFIRAMLVDSSILIFDEATSSVDTLTELRLQRALEILLKGRTSFIVAHRLSTIRKADEILVLDHGKIVERGNHESLLKKKGTYHHLHEEFVKSD